ncbi:MAG: hypothetical protein WC455_18360 [Dehalococcoidia bacterium]|jgi:hypothetical protein
MTYTTGKGMGQMKVWAESTLGTQTGSYFMVRPEEPPTVKANARTLVKVPTIGHQHWADGEATTVHAPQSVEAGAVAFKTAIYPAKTHGTIPSVVTLLKSSGLNCVVASADDVTTGSPAVGSIEPAAITPVVGGAYSVQLLNGQYWPMLAADVASDVITPSMDLPSAPAAVGGAVGKMWCFSPTTSVTYDVPDGLSLQFAWHSWARHTDALGDLMVQRIACALEGLGDITIPKGGERMFMDLSFYGMQKDFLANADIGADVFQDVGKPMFIDDNFRFRYASADVTGGITAANRYAKDFKINLGVTVEMNEYHGDSTIGLIQGYHIQFADHATITMTRGYDASAAAEVNKAMVAETNGHTYIELVQPSTSPTNASFGFWAPSCHLKEFPSVELHGNLVEYTCVYEARCANYDGTTTIAQPGASPWFLAFGGEAAAV